MRVNSNASELMSILKPKTEKVYEDSSDISEGFAKTFSSILRKAEIRNNESGYSNSSSVTPSQSLFNINHSSGYAEFRDTVINDTYELPEDMYSYNGTGKHINQKGYDYIYKRRVDNANPILPQNISEALEKYENSKENIEKYLTALYGNYNIHAFSSLSNNYMSFGYQSWGLQIFEDNQSEDNYFRMINSDAGKEVTALMEERNFYGALASLAKSNDDFATEYDADPSSAMNKYFRELGQSMASQDDMPKIDTRRNVPFVPKIFNASKGAYNQTEFIPLS